MNISLAFDIYGTLIDTHGVVDELSKLIGAQSQEFSKVWREKQLEYSFRRGLMRKYEIFSICTRNALDYACSYFKVQFSRQDKDSLMNAYQFLPAFKDVHEGLRRVKESGAKIYAFSNGCADAVDRLLINANIRDYFFGIVSVDEIKTYKPNPDVYRHLMQRTGSQENNTWLVSSNSFDVIGAISAGLQAVWVKRSAESVFDTWGIEPTLIIDSLVKIADEIVLKSGN